MVRRHAMADIGQCQPAAMAADTDPLLDAVAPRSSAEPAVHRHRRFAGRAGLLAGVAALLVSAVVLAAGRAPRSCRAAGGGRLDARPFDAESKAVEAEAREHRDVLAIPVIEVARVARGLAAWCGLDVLPPPPIAVRIAALGLIRGDRGAEKKAVGKAQRV